MTIERCPKWLQDVAQHVIHESGIAVTRIAELTGIPHDWLYSWGTSANNPSTKHRHPPLYAVTPLTKATHNPEIIYELCRQNGLQVPQPIATHVNESELEYLSMKGQVFLSRAMEQIACAMEDGRIDENDDINGIRTAFDHLREALSQIEQGITARCSGVHDIK